jgi:GDPmannose 4,6-dehydratase
MPIREAPVDALGRQRLGEAMTKASVALIFGITGQDGAYLAQHLLSRGYAVHGTSRLSHRANTANLQRLAIADQVTIHPAAVQDFAAVLGIIRTVRPSEIYVLAAQSSVGLSFEQPLETVSSITTGTLNVLEAVRLSKLDCRIFHASSSECFGNTPVAATEATAFQPANPYGIAKAAATWLVANYRDAYGVFACSGLLFNHESPLRPIRFVTRKIVKGAIEIAHKRAEQLELGPLTIARDWGWAPEYVEAMRLILQQDRPADFVIATGVLSTLREFVAQAFAYFGLDWERHVVSMPAEFRPVDVAASFGNPTRARDVLGWSAQTVMPTLVRRLIESELASQV